MSAAVVPTLALDGDRADDVAAIEAIVADVEAGFDENDAERMNRHVAADATIVNAVGGELRGRDRIMAASAAGLAGPLADERARDLVSDVTCAPTSPSPTSGPGRSTPRAETPTSVTPWSPSTCS